jgi:hypothetical protein
MPQAARTSISIAKGNLILDLTSSKASKIDSLLLLCGHTKFQHCSAKGHAQNKCTNVSSSVQFVTTH